MSRHSIALILAAALPSLVAAAGPVVAPAPPVVAKFLGLFDELRAAEAQNPPGRRIRWLSG